MVTNKNYIKILASVTCILLIWVTLISCNYLRSAEDKQPSPTQIDDPGNSNNIDIPKQSATPNLSSSLDYGLLNVADTGEKVRPSVVSIVSETVVRSRYGRARPAFGSGT